MTPAKKRASSLVAKEVEEGVLEDAAEQELEASEAAKDKEASVDSVKEAREDLDKEISEDLDKAVLEMEEEALAVVEDKEALEDSAREDREDLVKVVLEETEEDSADKVASEASAARAPAAEDFLEDVTPTATTLRLLPAPLIPLLSPHIPPHPVCRLFPLIV